MYSKLVISHIIVSLSCPKWIFHCELRNRTQGLKVFLGGPCLSIWSPANVSLGVAYCCSECSLSLSYSYACKLELGLYRLGHTATVLSLSLCLSLSLSASSCFLTLLSVSLSPPSAGVVSARPVLSPSDLLNIQQSALCTQYLCAKPRPRHLCRNSSTFECAIIFIFF